MDTLCTKRALPALIVAFLLPIGLHGSEINYADDSYTSGDVLTAADLNAKFNEIKADVNDNFSNITTHEANASAHHSKTANFSELSGQVSDGQVPDLITRDTELNAAIAAIPQEATYDYRDFTAASNITQKIYNHTGSCGGTSATEVWNYTRTPSGANTQIMIAKSRRDGSNLQCQYFIVGYLATDTTFYWTRHDSYSDDGSALLASRIFTPPIVKRTSSMNIGRYWGDAATTAPDSGTVVETTTLLGIEDVTVPYGPLTGCLKTQTNRARTWGGNFSRISWHCPNLGMVKSILVMTGGGNGSGRIWELSQVISTP